MKDSDVVIIDEAQRLRMDQLKEIRDKVAGMNKKCIFSYDWDQWINIEEKESGVLNISPRTPELKIFYANE